MTNFMSLINQDLQDIVALVRSNLSELDRMTLGAMVNFFYLRSCSMSTTGMS